MINWEDKTREEKRQTMKDLGMFRTRHVANYLGLSERYVRMFRSRLGIVGGRENIIFSPEYTEIVKKSKSRDRDKCTHHFHIQKCSVCTKILSSENKVNIPVELPEKFLIDGREYNRQEIKDLISVPVGLRTVLIN